MVAQALGNAWNKLFKKESLHILKENLKTLTWPDLNNGFRPEDGVKMLEWKIGWTRTKQG